MAFNATPLAPGLLHDAALRLAGETAPGAANDLVGEMGWPALLIPERDGGAAASLADMVAIVEALASLGVDLPVLPRCVGAVQWLTGLGDDAHARTLLAAVAEGRQRIVPLVSQCGAFPAAVRMNPNGTLRHAEAPPIAVAADAHATHGLLPVCCDDDGAMALLLLPREAFDGTLRQSLDGSAVRDLALDGLAVPAGAVVARGPAVQRAAEGAALASMLMTTVDTLAAMGTCIEHTIAHLNQRVQFGVALSSFQALRHRVVECYVMYEGARGLLLQTLREAEADLHGAGRGIRLAKLYLGHAGRLVAQAVVQLHGAMGMSEEVLAARLAKRMIANDFRHGDRLEQLGVLSAQPLIGSAT